MREIKWKSYWKWTEDFKNSRIDAKKGDIYINYENTNRNSLPCGRDKISDNLLFTGLKDKNDVEIYFNSEYVKFNYLDGCGDEQEEYGVIVLDLKYMLGICIKTNTGKILNIVQADLCNITVIGNIYQYPELLEKV